MEQTSFFIAAVIGLISLTGLIIYLAIYHKCKIWSEKDKSHILKLAQQQEFTRKIIEVQEDERKRIAQDLHDDLGALALQIKLNNNDLKTYAAGNPQLNQLIQKNEELANKVIQTSRSVAHDLMPVALQKGGLVEAIRQLTEDLNSNDKLKIGFESEIMKLPIEKVAEISLYRVLKEWVNNVIRHSEASELKVKLTNEDGLLRICINDNGQPFSFEKSRMNSNGFGLKNIEGRLTQLQAQFSFNNKGGEGNCFEINYPMIASDV